MTDHAALIRVARCVDDPPHDPSFQNAVDFIKKLADALEATAAERDRWKKYYVAVCEQRNEYQRERDEAREAIDKAIAILKGLPAVLDHEGLDGYGNDVNRAIAALRDARKETS